MASGGDDAAQYAVDAAQLASTWSLITSKMGPSIPPPAPQAVTQTHEANTHGGSAWGFSGQQPGAMGELVANPAVSAPHAHAQQAAHPADDSAVPLGLGGVLSPAHIRAPGDCAGAAAAAVVAACLRACYGRHDDQSRLAAPVSPTDHHLQPGGAQVLH